MIKKNLYDKGAELYEEEKFTEAIDVLEKAYENDHDDIDVIMLLAGCYIEIAHFTEAAKWLLVADKIDANNPVIKYNLGYALLCMGRLNDAIKYLKKCLRLNPPKEVKKMAKRMLKSEEYFAEKLDNNYAISLEEEFECQEKFSKAQKYLYSKEFEKAIFLYKSILEKKPNFERAMQNIGVCYIEDGKPEEALKHFEKSLEISPNDELCLGNLAHAHYLLGDFKKSREYSEKTISLVKDLLLRDLIRLVTLFIEIKQFGFARKLLTDYDNVYNNDQLTFLSGVLYAEQKEYLAAKEEFQGIRERSKTAMKYFEKTKQLIEGKIKEFDFKPRLAIDVSIDMI